MTTIDAPHGAHADLAAGFHGTLTTPSDSSYDQARAVWNGAIDRYPALIARVADEHDVAAAIDFARRHDLPLAVRGGGHNVAGSGSVDNGLVIDLGALNAVDVAADARRAVVGGGALWRDVDETTGAYGLHTTGGLISHTGVGGLTLGGGIGWLMRRHGLSCDNVVAARLVTADGETVVVDEATQPELLWALRGGGGNFGVVTSFTFRLHPVAEVLGGLMLYRGARAAEASSAYASWVAGLPDDLTTMGGFLCAPPEPFVPEDLRLQPAFAVLVCGLDVTACTPYVDELRRACPPDADVVGPMPYVALQSMLDAGAPHGLRTYWKSGCLTSLDPALLGHIVEASLRPRSPLSQIHLHHLGGATRGPADRAATSLGEAAWVLNVIGTWEQAAHDAENTQWVRDLWALAEPHTVGAYTNFLGDEGSDRTRSAYDAETWSRLEAVKRRWDPDNVFRINQNIPPA